MKILACLVPRFVVACALVLMTGACADPQVSRDKYFAQGNEAFEKAQYPEAILAYRNALKSDPRFGPARQNLAEAYRLEGNHENAAREFVRTAELLPDDAAAQLTAGTYLLAAGQFEDAAKRARRVLELDRRSVEGHILLGRALAAMKDLDVALDQIQEAISIDPSSGAGHANMGAILLAQGKKEAAQASFEQAVKLDPNSINAHLALATYHLAVGAHRDAEAAVKGALAIEPTNGQVNRAMALLLIGSGRAAEAEPYVKATVAAIGTSEAELSLAEYYLRANRAESARPILERLAADDKLFARASLRLARLEYATGRRDEAHKRVDGVLDRAPRDLEALVLKGQWMLAQGQRADALRLAQSAVKLDARSVPAQLLLGRAMASTGNREAAEAAFTEVLRLNPRAGAAQTELARVNLAAGKTEASVQFAREAITNEPRNHNARILLVRGLIARRDLAQARVEIAPLIRDLPDNPTVIAMNGRLLALNKNTAGATREYERALERDPLHIDALTGLTALDAQAGQLERARQRLSALLSRSPGNASLLLLAARADLRAKDFAMGEQRLRQVIELEPSSHNAYQLLAQTYLRQQKLDAARQELEKIVERQPRSVGAHTLIGMIFDLQNRPDEAEGAYRRALEIDPGAAVPANNLAYRYAERNHNLDEALTMARTAAARLEDQPEVLDTLGWVHYKKGELKEAISQFEASAQKDPANPMYHYHLGLAYAQAGEKAKARDALSEALRLSPSFDGADEARRILTSLQS